VQTFTHLLGVNVLVIPRDIGELTCVPVFISKSQRSSLPDIENLDKMTDTTHMGGCNTAGTVEKYKKCRLLTEIQRRAYVRCRSLLCYVVWW